MIFGGVSSCGDRDIVGPTARSSYTRRLCMLSDIDDARNGE